LLALGAGAHDRHHVVVDIEGGPHRFSESSTADTIITRTASNIKHQASPKTLLD
jgi:hypothetical protein